jgi:RHS repeat-associated protein
MLMRMAYADGTVVSYAYDANNNRTAMSDTLGDTSWNFDPLNRVTQQDDPFDRSLHYQYDAASNRVGITYPDENQVGYAYSPNNWLQNMTVRARHAVPLQTEYARDLVGNLTEIDNPNQTRTTVAYDKVYRTLRRDTARRAPTQQVVAFEYTYNEVGHITKAIKEYGWRKPSTVVETYGYDGLHRLSEFVTAKNNPFTVVLPSMQIITGNRPVDAIATSYSYDPVGNRLSWESTDNLQTNTPRDGFSRSYAYNEANQMLGVEYVTEKNSTKDYAYEYSYDENGNRINRQLIDKNGPQYGVDYSYDAENRLVAALDYQITSRNGKNRIERAMTHYEYDGGGRRMVQHYDPKNGGVGVDKRDEYVFDGLDPVAEYDILNGQRTDYYRGAGNHLALMHHYKGGTQGQMYWYHYNHKGDVVGLTKQNGNSHHNYRYDPYGAVLPENGNFTDPHNHYTLTGKEFDENTGLIWFGSRFYEPESGVWVNQDVYRGRLREPGSLHRYGYVGNNPVSYWDWYGFKLQEQHYLSGEVKKDEGYVYRDLTTEAFSGYIDAPLVNNVSFYDTMLEAVGEANKNMDKGDTFDLEEVHVRKKDLRPSLIVLLLNPINTEQYQDMLLAENKAFYRKRLTMAIDAMKNCEPDKAFNWLGQGMHALQDSIFNPFEYNNEEFKQLEVKAINESKKYLDEFIEKTGYVPIVRNDSLYPLY